MRNWLKYLLGEEMQPDSSFMMTRTPDHKHDGVCHLTFCATGTSDEMAALEAQIKTVMGKGGDNAR